MLRLILELPIQAPNQPTAKADSTKKDLYLWIIYMGALPPIIGAAPGILRVEFSGQKTTLPPLDEASPFCALDAGASAKGQD